jgi:hypothetical protein
LRTREAREVLSAGVTRPPEAARREGMANAHFDMSGGGARLGCAVLCCYSHRRVVDDDLDLALESRSCPSWWLVARASLPDFSEACTPLL